MGRCCLQKPSNERESIVMDLITFLINNGIYEQGLNPCQHKEALVFVMMLQVGSSHGEKYDGKYASSARNCREI